MEERFEGREEKNQGRGINVEDQRYRGHQREITIVRKLNFTLGLLTEHPTYVLILHTYFRPISHQLLREQRQNAPSLLADALENHPLQEYCPSQRKWILNPTVCRVPGAK